MGDGSKTIRPVIGLDLSSTVEDSLTGIQLYDAQKAIVHTLKVESTPNSSPNLLWQAYQRMLLKDEMELRGWLLTGDKERSNEEVLCQS